jgi:HD-like signal output (HDOD) protein
MRESQVVSTADVVEAANKPGVLGAGAATASVVLATLYRPQVGVREIARVVGSEPGMTTRVLRVANSPLYGQSRTVSTIEHAVLLLGLEAVRSIAAAACMRDAILRTTPSGPVDGLALLRHSVGTALAARMLSSLNHAAPAEDAFVAGLVHDLGLTVLARLRPESIAAVMNELRAGPARDSSALEEERLGISHARCAAAVFESWHLPAALVSAAAHHHDPWRAPVEHAALAAIVSVADELTRTCGLGFVCEASPAAAGVEDASAVLGLSRDDLDAVAAELPARLGELERALL